MLANHVEIGKQYKGGMNSRSVEIQYPSGRLIRSRPGTCRFSPPYQ